MSQVVQAANSVAKGTLSSPGLAAGKESEFLVRCWLDVAIHFQEPSTRSGGPEDEFSQLADQWQQQTAHLSSVTERVAHPAYLRIIGMGRPVLPFLLKRLQNAPGHWFTALTAISGVDPVPPDDAGRVRRMTEEWLKWGREQGII